MFEKWRIKEHMEVVDTAGRHVGTVDEVEGDRIKLTRSDSSDGAHHYLDISAVDKIDDNRVYLNSENSLANGDTETADSYAGTVTSDTARPGPEGSGGFAGDATTYSPGTNQAGSDVNRPYFGTSGQGTGFGGSGAGN